MLHGDISNSAEGSIAFRIDKFLFRLNSDKKTFNLDLNVLKAIENVYFGSFYTVDVVCCMPAGTDDFHEFEFREELEELLIFNKVPYSRIYTIKNEIEIRLHLIRGLYLYYVDDVEEHVSSIAHEHCIDLSQLSALLTGRVRRSARRI